MSPPHFPLFFFFFFPPPEICSLQVGFSWNVPTAAFCFLIYHINKRKAGLSCYINCFYSQSNTKTNCPPHLLLRILSLFMPFFLFFLLLSRIGMSVCVCESMFSALRRLVSYESVDLMVHKKITKQKELIWRNTEEKRVYHHMCVDVRRLAESCDNIWMNSIPLCPHMPRSAGELFYFFFYISHKTGEKRRRDRERVKGKTRGRQERRVRRVCWRDFDRMEVSSVQGGVELRQLFQACDRHQRGYIDRSEFGELCASFQIDSSDVDVIFADLDRDGDQRIR